MDRRARRGDAPARPRALTARSTCERTRHAHSDPLNLRRAGATAVALLLLALALAGVSTPAAPGATQAVGVPVVIDGFGNPAIPQPSFLRSIVPLPLPHTSTTPQGVFSQADGVGTMDMVGTGNGTSGITLVYKPPAGSVDLASLGSNGQIFIDFALINQQPAPGQWATGVTTYMTATDASGNVATSPSDAVGNFFAFNAAFRSPASTAPSTSARSPSSTSASSTRPPAPAAGRFAFRSTRSGRHRSAAPSRAPRPRP